MSSALMVGVSGLRGVIGSSLTPEVASRFAGSFGSWLVEQGAGRPVAVALGRDGRAGSAFLYHAAVSGLLASGAAVVDMGVVTTPTAAVMTDHLAARRPGELIAGMELTASHNPQQWNGLKCLDAAVKGLHGSAACAPAEATARRIIERFSTGTFPAVAWDRLGAVERDETAVAVHIERALNALAESGVCDEPGDLARGLSVALDSVNGSGIEAGSTMLEQLGVSEMLQIGDEPNGIFPHTPEPTQENLVDLAQAVTESEAAVGFAQDPDADRLALIDERGVYIGEEYTLVLSALAVLEAMKRRGEPTEGATLVINLSTSRMLEDVAARFGALVVRTPVGEANVVEEMKARGAVLGGEGNGGVIWPRVTYVRDSIAGMGLILSLLGGGRRTLSEIVSTIPAYAIVKRKVDLARKEDARPAVEKLAKAFANKRVDLQDGVRVDDDGSRTWFHVRASNTEPILRLIAEAPTRAQAEAALREAESVIRG